VAHFGDFCQIVRNAVKLKIAARQRKLLYDILRSAVELRGNAAAE